MNFVIAGVVGLVSFFGTGLAWGATVGDDTSLADGAQLLIGAIRDGHGTLAAAIALVVAVTVEIAANPNGMGYAMMIAQQGLDPALMLAWLGWIGVVGYVINLLTLKLQQRVARAMGEAA